MMGSTAQSMGIALAAIAVITPVALPIAVVQYQVAASLVPSSLRAFAALYGQKSAHASRELAIARTRIPMLRITLTQIMSVLNSSSERLIRPMNLRTRTCSYRRSSRKERGRSNSTRNKRNSSY